VSIKQKRLQLPTKFSDVVVGLANPGWQTVTEPWSSGSFVSLSYHLNDE